MTLPKLLPQSAVHKRTMKMTMLAINASHAALVRTALLRNPSLIHVIRKEVHGAS